MSLSQLSTEIIQKIYESADLVDVLHLAQTSKKNYNAFLGRQLPILEQAIHNSYSPVSDLIKLVFSNEPDKIRRPIGTEIRRNALVSRVITSPPKPILTIDLMKKMIPYGRIAAKWVEIYPRFRWRIGFKNRRLLHLHESERLRSAIYHHWTYTNLFHDPTYIRFDPDPPRPNNVSDPRLRLLRTYTSIELVQLSEYLEHMTSLLETDLYPSDHIIRDRHFPATFREYDKLAWGQGRHYRMLIDDLLKYNPEDLLHLVENTSTKAERMDYLLAKGIVFADAPATLNAGLSCLASERNLDGMKWFSKSGKWIIRPSLPSLAAGGIVDIEDEDIRYGIVDFRDLRDGKWGFDEKFGCDASESGVFNSRGLGAAEDEDE
ncbi:hypothetical protein B7494_g5270 [Chlorociboria aeruginascens]|nr:hypothetical protein B7494_g5270 [Chlorociboria aeruginascens]